MTYNVFGGTLNLNQSDSEYGQPFLCTTARV